MQLIKLENGHWNFFCPVTGKEAYKEDGGVNAETFCDGWHHEVWETTWRVLDLNEQE
jgi:hypothetical protein